jgi:hypothetical protein
MESLMKDMKSHPTTTTTTTTATSTTISAAAMPGSPNHSMPSLMPDDTNSCLSSFEDVNSIACVASLNPVETNMAMTMFGRPLKRIKLFPSTPSDYVDAYLTSNLDYEPEETERHKKVPSWKLTFKKGNICIETNVSTHTDMLNNLHQMLGTTELAMSIPPVYERKIPHNKLIALLNTLIRRKYGKTHCKNVAKSVRIFISPDISAVDTMVVAKAPDSMQTTTMKLLRAYLRCQHLQQLAIHSRTFIRLFMNDGPEIADSPAAMALCAVICTLRCKHVANCLPSISLVEYGKFYYERARELLSDLFDQFDLETLTCYTFLSIYKFTVSHADEAWLYTDMAERIAVVLEPHYTDIIKQHNKRNTSSEEELERQGEAVHFFRLRNHMHRVQTFEEISRSPPKKRNLTPKDKDLPFCTLLHMSEGRWESADDDSVQEKWFVQMHRYILQLQRAEHDASRAAQSCDLQYLIKLISHQVEMALRHWYTKILPIEFRLSLPLFDSTVDSKLYFTTLETETAHSAIPVLTTLALYEEYLVLAQSYLPKEIGLPENSWRRLNSVWQGGPVAPDSVNRKWAHRIQKLMNLRKAIEFEGTDHDFLMTVNTMLLPAEAGFDNHLVITALHAAFNTIRLVQFLRSRAADCYFDIRILINAWQMLLVVSKLKEIMPAEILVYMPRIHENLGTCLEIVREELKLQPYQGMVGDYVAEMEEDIKSQVIRNDDCDCVACPNA